MTNHPAVTDARPRDARRGAEYERSLRAWSKHLYLWGLCDNAACRLAKACRGHAQPCMDAHFSRLPAGAQEWFKVMICAKAFYDVPFDEVMRALNESGVNEVLLEWQRAVASGRDMREPGAVQEIDQRCIRFAAWKKREETEQASETV